MINKSTFKVKKHVFYSIRASFFANLILKTELSGPSVSSDIERSIIVIGYLEFNNSLFKKILRF